MVCTRAFPNVRVPDQRAALVVAERPGHDLAGARRVPVDQHGEAEVRWDRPGPRAKGDGLLVGALGGDDRRPLGEERARDPDGLGDEPAGVAAQVEHHAADAVEARPEGLA